MIDIEKIGLSWHPWIGKNYHRSMRVVNPNVSKAGGLQSQGVKGRAVLAGIDRHHAVSLRNVLIVSA